MKERVSKEIEYVAASIAVLIILLIIYALKDIYPFGSRIAIGRRLQRKKARKRLADRQTPGYCREWTFHSRDYVETR